MLENLLALERLEAEMRRTTAAVIESLSGSYRHYLHTNLDKDWLGIGTVNGRFERLAHVYHRCFQDLILFGENVNELRTVAAALNVVLRAKSAAALLEGEEPVATLQRLNLLARLQPVDAMDPVPLPVVGDVEMRDSFHFVK